MNNPGRYYTVLMLAILCLGGAALRFHRMDSPIDGYHATNEAWYAMTAENYRHTGPLAPTTVSGIRDWKARPLYGYAAYVSGRIFGFDPWSARLPAAVFSVAAILLIYLIGSRAAGSIAGLWAAAMWAVCPISVVVGRNAQPDAMYVTLTLAAYYFYDLSLERNRPRMKILSGVFFALAALTKNLAVAFVPAVILWELTDRRSPKRFRNILWFLLPAVILPAPLILYHLHAHAEQFLGTYARAATGVPSAKFLSYMFQEVVWAVSPFFAAMALGALLMPRRRKLNSPGIFIFFAAFLGVYFIQNVHSYYLLGAVPWILLLAAAIVSSMRSSRRALIGGVAVVFAAALTVQALAALKPAHSRFEDLRDDLKHFPGGTLVVSNSILGNYGPAIAYTVRNYRIVPMTDVIDQTPEGRAAKLKPPIFLLNFTMQRIDSPYVKQYSYTVGAFQLGRRIAGFLPSNVHSFVPHSFLWRKAGRPAAWGTTEFTNLPFMRLIRAPAGWVLVRRGRSLEVRPPQ